MHFITVPIAVMAIIAWSFRDALILKKRVSVNRFFLLLVLVTLFYPATVGLFRGVGFDFAIVKMLMSVVVMIFIGAITANALSCERDENQISAAMTRTFVVIMFINSLIVIGEFLVPDFRIWKEGFLRSEMKTDYLEGFRYRGVASAGGANLSVATGVAAVLSLWLWARGWISGIFAFVFLLILLGSLVFIGRTGLVVFSIGAFAVLFLSITSTRSRIRIFFAAVLFLSIAFVIAQNLYELLPPFYQSYTIDLFINGVDGLIEEGSVVAIGGFYVFPDNLNSLVFGVGNFSGGFERGYDWPGDPGFMKLVTAFGMPLSVVLYGGLAVWILGHERGHLRSLTFLIFFLLLICEWKEPFLLKGYTSRLFWFLIGVRMYYSGSVRFFEKFTASNRLK